MMTLNALGRHGAELTKFFRGSLNDSEAELKILIDGPIQVEEIRKILEPLGFSNFVLEDDEGNLYLTTSRKIEADESPREEENPPAPVAPAPSMPQAPEHKEIKREASIVLKHSTGVLISCEQGKYKNIFMKKILISLVNSKIKPEVLALMNGAVSLAAYNSSTCAYLKELEAAGVKILISGSCADFLGLTEAIGAGSVVDMSEILEEIFSCEKVISL